MTFIMDGNNRGFMFKSLTISINPKGEKIDKLVKVTRSLIPEFDKYLEEI